MRTLEDVTKEVQAKVGGGIEQEDVEHMAGLIFGFERFANERGLSRAAALAQSLHMFLHLKWAEEQSLIAEFMKAEAMGDTPEAG